METKSQAWKREDKHQLKIWIDSDKVMKLHYIADKQNTKATYLLRDYITDVIDRYEIEEGEIPRLEILAFTERASRQIARPHNAGKTPKETIEVPNNPVLFDVIEALRKAPNSWYVAGTDNIKRASTRHTRNKTSAGTRPAIFDKRVALNFTDGIHTFNIALSSYHWNAIDGYTAGNYVQFIAVALKTITGDTTEIEITKMIHKEVCKWSGEKWSSIDYPEN